jgi:hypothetical protein
MAYIEGNFFPMKVFVRDEYLYQKKKGHGQFTEAVILSVVKLHYFKSYFLMVL